MYVAEELRFHELYGRSHPGDDEFDSQSRYRQVCRSLSTCCYGCVLRALATNDVTVTHERLSANDVLALCHALEVSDVIVCHHSISFIVIINIIIIVY